MYSFMVSIAFVQSFHGVRRTLFVTSLYSLRNMNLASCRVHCWSFDDKNGGKFGFNANEAKIHIQIYRSANTMTGLRPQILKFQFFKQLHNSNSTFFRRLPSSSTSCYMICLRIQVGHVSFQPPVYFSFFLLDWGGQSQFLTLLWQLECCASSLGMFATLPFH